jgi:hypothetical protein
MGVEGIQQARLLKANARLQARQRFIINKKRCLYRAVVSPKPYGVSRVVV